MGGNSLELLALLAAALHQPLQMPCRVWQEKRASLLQHAPTASCHPPGGHQSNGRQQRQVRIAGGGTVANQHRHPPGGHQSNGWHAWHHELHTEQEGRRAVPAAQSGREAGVAAQKKMDSVVQQSGADVGLCLRGRGQQHSAALQAASQRGGLNSTSSRRWCSYCACVAAAPNSGAA